MMHGVGGEVSSPIMNMFEESMVCVKIGRGLEIVYCRCEAKIGMCDVTMVVQHLC
jgi:hypothetical protein